MRLWAPILAGALALACGSSDGAGGGGSGGGGGGDRVSVEVAGVFEAGTVLRDHYGQRVVTVSDDGTVALTLDPAGVVLLERDGAAATPFDWGNVTMYQVITDRFANGDPANDGSYGRLPDGAEEVGTWHGGDFVGLLGKLDYVASLGVDAIWISPIVEQVHGWVGGGDSGAFRHHAYHGYWALDFTRLDQSFGTEEELESLIDAAHARGIRVIVDVVLNHPGYATGADLIEYLPEVFHDGTGDAFKTFDETATSGLHEWNDLVDFQSTAWQNWWSPLWIRAGFPGFPAPGSSDLTSSLSFLPDFITESETAADIPVLFMRKGDTGFVELPESTVREYLVAWHADWVRRFGIDGFRVDSAKHVELATFEALKEHCTAALAEWKAQNPAKKIDDASFWMTAEVFSHGVVKDAYHTSGGFDSVINFDFQTRLGGMLQAVNGPLGASDDLDDLYDEMASAIFGDSTFGILSYVSSHDTRLHFSFVHRDAARQREAGTALLLAPGGVNVFYGDESGRRDGPTGGDLFQSTRSDMNFADIDDAILQHWQKVGTFRARHAAVGAGAHQRLASPAGAYAFSRKLGADAVVVILGARS
jgi:alpha-amylase